MRTFSTERLNLNLIEIVGMFVLHFVSNIPEVLGNIGMLNSNAFLRAFIPEMPILVGGVRPAEVLLPNDYDPTLAYPLLVLIPGYSDDRYYIEKKFNLLAKAADRGYISIAPNGIRNSVN